MDANEMKYTPSPEEVEKLVEPLAALLCSVRARKLVRDRIMAAIDKRVDEDDQLARKWIGN